MTTMEADNKDLRELTTVASWSLSSYKSGFGLQQLTNSNLDSFWQSDGPQPHYCNISFHKRHPISKVSIYLDFKQDESYTPNKIQIKAGTNITDLQEFTTRTLNEPTGWQDFSLLSPDPPFLPLKVFMIQIVIISNHQDGKDTHVRSIKVYSPINSVDSFVPSSSAIKPDVDRDNDETEEDEDLWMLDVYNNDSFR